MIPVQQGSEGFKAQKEEKEPLVGVLSHHRVSHIKKNSLSIKLNKIEPVDKKIQEHIQPVQERSTFSKVIEKILNIFGRAFPEPKVRARFEKLPEKEEAKRVLKAKAQHFENLDPARGLNYLIKLSSNDLSGIQTHLKGNKRKNVEHLLDVKRWIATYEKKGTEKLFEEFNRFSDDQVRMFLTVASSNTSVEALKDLLTQEAKRAELSKQGTFLRENNGTSRLFSAFYEKEIPKATVDQFLKELKSLDNEMGKVLKAISKRPINLRTKEDETFLDKYAQGILEKAQKTFSKLPKEVLVIHESMGRDRALSAFFLRGISPKIAQSNIDSKMFVSSQVQRLANGVVRPQDPEVAKAFNAQLDQLQKVLIGKS